MRHGGTRKGHYPSGVRIHVPTAAPVCASRGFGRRRGARVVRVNGYPAVVPKLLAAVVVALAFPGAALAVSQSPPKPVVGAGTINVPLLAVRSAPGAEAPVIARLSEFRPQDYRPSLRARDRGKKGRNGKPAWYKITVPGRPNGRTGWVPAQAGLDPADAVAGRRLPRLARGAALEGQAARLHGQGRGRRPGMETPIGLYYVTVRFKPVAEPFLGAFAFETSAYSKLSEWPGGGVVGLHGSTRPSARAGRLARLHPDVERDR